MRCCERKGPSYYFREDLPLALSHGTILDVETTGLEPSRSGIVCFGSISGSTLEIRCRARDSGADDFYRQLNAVLMVSPQPFYAYNAKFDASMLQKRVGYRGPRFIDLFEPWRSRAEAHNIKFPSLDELVRGPWDALPPQLVPVREEIPANAYLREDELQWLRKGRRFRREAWEFRGLVSGKDVPKLWRDYLNGEDEALVQIAEHNRQDLLKTLCLLTFLGRPLTA